MISLKVGKLQDTSIIDVATSSTSKHYIIFWSFFHLKLNKKWDNTPKNMLNHSLFNPRGGTPKGFWVWVSVGQDYKSSVVSVSLLASPASWGYLL